MDTWACLKGRDKLENAKNKVFDYSMFNYRIDTHSDISMS